MTDQDASWTVVVSWRYVPRVSGLPTVRVAAVQATPVILDAEGTVDKTVRLLAEAAGKGARLAVFPETFIAL
jgi:hypothetical protein